MENQVYLAARFSRQSELRGYVSDLENCGFGVTSRWVKTDSHRVDEYQAEADPDFARRLAEEDYLDVLCADIVVIFGEEPRTATRGGKHVEFGLALARDKHIFLVGPRENVFYYLPEVECYETWDECFEVICRRFG